MKSEIHQYEDYRRFLRDRFEELQAADPSFSQRRFSKKAGFANPGFLNEVIKGRRKLSAGALEKAVLGLSLTAQEAEFLALMVDFNHAKTEPDRQAAYASLAQRRSRKSFLRLGENHSEYYRDPHYALVRAAIEVADFRGDYDRLARCLRPPMPASAVKRCVRNLCDWGLVRQDRHGRYLVTHTYLEPPRNRKELLKSINREWILQAAVCQERYQPHNRHISTALMTVSESTYQEVLRYMKKVREHVLDLVKQDQGPGRVVQFNIQVLPRTGSKEECA